MSVSAPCLSCYLLSFVSFYHTTDFFHNSIVSNTPEYTYVLVVRKTCTVLVITQNLRWCKWMFCTGEWSSRINSQFPTRWTYISHLFPFWHDLSLPINFQQNQKARNAQLDYISSRMFKLCHNTDLLSLFRLAFLAISWIKTLSFVCEICNFDVCGLG